MSRQVQKVWSSSLRTRQVEVHLRCGASRGAAGICLFSGPAKRQKSRPPVGLLSLMPPHWLPGLRTPADRKPCQRCPSHPLWPQREASTFGWLESHRFEDLVMASVISLVTRLSRMLIANWLLLLSSQFAVAKTAHDVIVHHPRGLHVGVADRRAHEPETAPQQLNAHSL